MAAGKNDGLEKDPLTDWASASMDILKEIHPGAAIQDMEYRDKMLMLVKALDQGELDSIFGNVTFIRKTEDLLLTMLRGERIEVVDPVVYNARNEIFAAAQVIYNQGVARGFWKLHPKFQQAMDENQ